MAAGFPQTTVKRGGEADRHLACNNKTKQQQKTETSVGTEKRCACGPFSVGLNVRLWEAESTTLFRLQCIFVRVRWCCGMWAGALFPLAVTRAAESLVTYTACVFVGGVSLSLSLCVCLSFCLISTSCFILGLIQTQHSCAVSQRKGAWGMGCQVWVTAALLHDCFQQMEGKWGYQLGLILSL